MGLHQLEFGNVAKPCRRRPGQRRNKVDDNRKSKRRRRDQRQLLLVCARRRDRTGNSCQRPDYHNNRDTGPGVQLQRQVARPGRKLPDHLGRPRPLLRAQLPVDGRQEQQVHNKGCQAGSQHHHGRRVAQAHRRARRVAVGQRHGR